MIIREISCKTALSRTGIPGYDYCLNPYVGCGHGCSYCYATFMKRFTGHGEPWGQFVDVRVTIADVLKRQLKRMERGSVIVGTVTDPYQPLERKYALTRQCLVALASPPLSVHILTRSPLVLRDIDVLAQMPAIEVGLTITTDRDDIRRIFEPRAPAIASRIEALRALHDAGIRTYVFIGPMLPMDPLKLADMIGTAADDVLIDRLNYSYKVGGLVRRHRLEPQMSPARHRETARELEEAFIRKGIAVTVLF